MRTNPSFSALPTKEMSVNARRGLKLRKMLNRGGTAVGVARARDIINRKNLSEKTILRMYSYFARHNGEAKNVAKDGNPSAGAIAWLLWGGNEGKNWAKAQRLKILKLREEKEMKNPQSPTRHRAKMLVKKARGGKPVSKFGKQEWAYVNYLQQKLGGKAGHKNPQKILDEMNKNIDSLIKRLNKHL